MSPFESIWPATLSRDRETATGTKRKRSSTGSAAKLAIIQAERMAANIYMLGSQKVMLDSELAALYGVETRALVQAIKRNQERFPEDFMFQLSKKEFENWRSQIVISNPGAKKTWRGWWRSKIAKSQSFLKVFRG